MHVALVTAAARANGAGQIWADVHRRFVHSESDAVWAQQAYVSPLPPRPATLIMVEPVEIQRALRKIAAAVALRVEEGRRSRV